MNLHNTLIYLYLLCSSVVKKAGHHCQHLAVSMWLQIILTRVHSIESIVDVITSFTPEHVRELTMLSSIVI